MAEGHESNYIGFKYHESGDHDGAEMRDFTLDGNQFNQGTEDSGDTPNGFGFEVAGSSQDVLVENVRVKDWATVGGLAKAKGVVVRYCSFLNNGQAVEQNNDYLGHGLNVGNDASSPDDGECLVEYCYFSGTSGTSIDNNGGNFTMRRCYSESNGWGMKFNDGVRSTIEHSRFNGVDKRGPYTVQTSGGCGVLELRDVELTDVGYEAIATRMSGTVRGDNIKVVNGNTEGFHDGEAVRFENKRVDIGTLSVNDTSSGGVFDVTDSSGSVSTLIRDGNSGGLGDTGGVSIQEDTTGSAITVDAPTASDVGAGAMSDSSEDSTDDSTDNSSTSYDHLLEVEAADGADLTTYAITVTGDAVLGANANMQESVTETSDGNSLLEGQVADGGLDDFQFNGEIVEADSSIDGDATPYVDGSQVSLTDDTSSDTEYGNYAQPDPGSTDWHKPLNDNFEQLSQEVQELVSRIETLEQKHN
jgi:hypothetical protein